MNNNNNIIILFQDFKFPPLESYETSYPSMFSMIYFLNNYISWEVINIPYFGMVFWGLFLKSPGNFYVFHVCFKIKVYFENDKKKLSVNKAKLTSLGARKWTTIQQVLILKFAFLPKKLLGLSGNEALERTILQELAWKRSHT